MKNPNRIVWLSLFGALVLAVACGGPTTERGESQDDASRDHHEAAGEVTADAVDTGGADTVLDGSRPEALEVEPEVNTEAVADAPDPDETGTTDADGLDSVEIRDAVEATDATDLEPGEVADGSDPGGEAVEAVEAIADPGPDPVDPDGAEVDEETTGVPVGAPCDGDDECAGGRCVWGPAGRECAVGCQSDADCSADHACRNVSTGGPKVGACVVRHLGLCRPCRVDGDCVAYAYAAGALCLSRDAAEGAFCATACGGSAACPAGFACLALVSPPDVSVCVPEQDGCDCDPVAIGAEMETPCTRVTPDGACQGARVCGPAGLTACDAAVPAPEACDGADNDCDGATDEGFGVVACGVGACATSVDACVSGVARTCAPLEGKTEACNGLDDDCDGATDEDQGEAACGEGECATSVVACQGGAPRACVPQAGAPEVCDGLDNDCDGATDEGQGTLGCGEGACATSAPACLDGQPQPCVPLPFGGPEACNGLDDDCDGQTDEELGVATCGAGECARSVAACVAGLPQACVPGQPAAAEVCDGEDDDCDGQTDEGFSTLTCGEGACRVTVVACTGGSPAECVPKAAGAEACNGVDDDCDGQTDEEFGAVSCGLGECAVSVEACRNGVPQTCSPLPPASAEACDGRDDDCDGQTDEGFGALTCGKGACAASVQACLDGVPHACVPLAGAPEGCDGVDNDCDGATDEGLGILTCGLGVCATSVAGCVGGSPMACQPLPVASAEACNGKDDDCDGATDEGLGQLTCGLGVCANAVEACRNGVGQTCTPLPFATAEACNAKDDDCDGATDEALGTLTCGLGVCATSVAACVNGGVPLCQPNWAAQTAETCNGLDDDCDGQSDEGMGGSWCVRYAPIDATLATTTSAQLVAALHALVTEGSVAFSYSGARARMYQPGGIEVRADGRIECVYTARSTTSVSSDPGSFPACELADGSVCASCDVTPSLSKCSFNTEHAWPRSRIKEVHPENTPEYVVAEADIHHLFPTWYQANSHRSNYLYGETACVPADGSCNWPDAFEAPETSMLGYPSSPGYPGDLVFEVRPERRGDVARAWFYMSVRYQMSIVDYVEAVLRSWHQADPPDQRELDRNAGVDAVQKNRNPFVDRPGYVTKISDF